MSLIDLFKRKEIVHDYSKGHRSWGHDYCITKVINKGQELKVMGWGYYLSEGDYIKLEDGEQGSHYLIKEIEYLNDPKDMWKATLRFPRDLSKKI